jgi:hypothetical protein
VYEFSEKSVTLPVNKFTDWYEPTIEHAMPRLLERAWGASTRPDRILAASMALETPMETLRFAA